MSWIYRSTTILWKLHFWSLSKWLQFCLRHFRFLYFSVLITYGENLLWLVRKISMWTEMRQAFSLVGLRQYLSRCSNMWRARQRISRFEHSDWLTNRVTIFSDCSGADLVTGMCVCDDGYVMEGGQCIRKSNCGCNLEDGSRVPNGFSQTSRDCSIMCQCTDSYWNCKQHY